MKEFLNIPDVRTEPLYDKDKEVLADTRGLLVWPVFNKENELIGTFEFFGKCKRFNEMDEKIARKVAQTMYSVPRDKFSVE